jgi:hypothetical protein
MANRTPDPHAFPRRNGPQPDEEAPPSPPLEADVLLTLLLDHPTLQRALKRPQETDEAKHALYDVLLADAGSRAGWEVAQIVALIREGNRRSARPVPSQTYCELMLHEAQLRTQTGDLDMARERLLDSISDTWGLALAAVIKHGAENTLWHLRLVDGREISLGTTKDLFSQPTMRQRIFEVTNHLIPRYGAKDLALWDHHIQVLALVAQTVDTPEMTREGQVIALIRGYTEAQQCDLTRDNSTEEWEDLALTYRPFVRGGWLYVSARHLLAYARVLDTRMTSRDLLDLLRLVQGRRVTVALHIVDQTCRRLWRLPIKELQEEGVAEDLPGPALDDEPWGTQTPARTRAKPLI